MRGLLLLGCGMVGILEGPSCLRALRDGRPVALPVLFGEDASARVDARPARALPADELPVDVASRERAPEIVAASLSTDAGPVRVAVEVIEGDSLPLLDAGSLSGRPTHQEVGGQ